jgi:hypothetical protein
MGQHDETAPTLHDATKLARDLGDPKPYKPAAAKNTRQHGAGEIDGCLLVCMGGRMLRKRTAAAIPAFVDLHAILRDHSTYRPAARLPGHVIALFPARFGLEGCQHDKWRPDGQK